VTNYDARPTIVDAPLMHILKRESNGHITLWLTMMQGQQLLMLRWCTFSRWGSEHVTFCFFYKGGQYFVYDCLQPVAVQITQDTRPTIVDAPLTLIIKLGQGRYRSLLYLFRWPEIGLWLSATYQRCDYLGCRTTNRWRYVDADFHVMRSQYLLPSMSI